MEWRWFLLSIFVMFLGCNTNEITRNLLDKNLVEKVKDASGNVYFTGLKIPKNFKPDIVQSALKTQVGELPASFDWRDKVALSPVENQGSCGSCWAFSTAATFQDALRVKGESRNLSEQYLLSCTKPGEWNCANGGFFAHDMHMSPKGGVDAADYPYTGSDSTCRTGLTYHQKVARWAYLPGGETPSVAEIKSALVQFGPLSVGVAADDQFSNYKSGIFMGSGSTQLNHAVNIVGYGSENGQEYFIMRNSWGNWGENGYMRAAIINGKAVNGLGAWANYVVYEGGNPDPNPSPDPTPGPTPPPECTPKPVASTGFGASIWIKAGQSVKIGMKPRAETTYYWTAVPDFEGAAKPIVSMISFKPAITKTLTIHAVTKCGEATASTKVNVNRSIKGAKEEIVPVEPLVLSK